MYSSVDTKHCDLDVIYIETYKRNCWILTNIKVFK